MKHIDAFTGEEFTGKAIVLSTTEGPAITSWVTLDQLRREPSPDLADVVAALTARVEELEDRLRDTTADKSPEPEPAPAKTSTRTRKAADQ